MTFNEFKLCCICFCKKYDGKCLGEIFEDIVPSLRRIKISIIYNSFDTTREVYFRVCGYIIFEFCEGKIQYVQQVKKNLKISSRWSDVDMTLFNFEDIV